MNKSEKKLYSIGLITSAGAMLISYSLFSNNIIDLTGFLFIFLGIPIVFSISLIISMISKDNSLRFAEVVKIDERFFRKEQISYYTIDDKVEIVHNDKGEVVEIRKLPETTTFKFRIKYLDDIFKVVRAYGLERDGGDGENCSICGDLKTSGYFVKKKRGQERLFIGYLCWKSSLSPKL